MATEMNLSKLTKKELIKEVLDWRNMSDEASSIISEKKELIKKLHEQIKLKSDYNTIMTEEFQLKDEEIKKLKEKNRQLNLDKIKKEVEDEADIEMLKDEIKQLQHDFDSDEKNMHYKKMGEELEKVKPIILHLMEKGIIESVGNGKQYYHKRLIDRWTGRQDK